MKEIELTRGKTALVDDRDFSWLNQWKWFAVLAGRHWRACRNILVGSKRRSLYMHRFILGLTFGDRRIIDHVDGNELNNQRSNLRIANRSQNRMNQHYHFGKSQYKGVIWSVQHNKWRAKIKVTGNTIHLGLFKLEEDAAKAYDIAACRHFKDFAKTNFGGTVNESV